ncbi:heparan sulfate glucosamine 3-O-sulfotransferase 1-like [Acanthaster planci]|uniref:Heparan sulfate glucosamine 3-O-sulfotransferase 1-like n=1 Tax=Acanthaster planci TaxID=133434 RepID=A0A8B7XRP9_ACAPL|nr:heparan sulfate glucosamine 3-O-sulfotransferase 1-like [Acanthaster planci]
MSDADTFASGRSWRRMVASFALAFLLLTFTLGILGGTYPHEESHVEIWSKPDAGYQSEVDKPFQSTHKVYPDQTGSISGDKSFFPNNVTCDRCCYRYTTVENGIMKILSQPELKERGCKKRLPDAMIFGVKKGGTTTLKNFLSYHPDIAFTQEELKFFTSSEDREKGLEFYRREMIYSTPDQISMEKTPAYSHYPKVPAMIAKVLPDVKLIIIMRDPVERAVSDYVHMQVTIAKKCKKGKASSKCSIENSGYFIADTFEESVIDSDGEVNYSNQLVAKGLYVIDIKRYLKYFKSEQILAIDGEAFINNPYPAVKKVEEFLGIRDYFARDHFYFDVQKGFFCLNKPIPNNCMKKAKGRPHPDVNDQTLRKLRDYYRPYNKALNQLMETDFHWS